jgi:hypothetical protein
MALIHIIHGKFARHGVRDGGHTILAVESARIRLSRDRDSRYHSAARFAVAARYRTSPGDPLMANSHAAWGSVPRTPTYITLLARIVGEKKAGSARSMPHCGRPSSQPER